jgi:ATP synthase protein I
MSALLGGAACVVPNGLFALKLAASARRQGTKETGPAVFLVGEFVKVASTVALLALVVATYPKLNWLAMIVGIIVVLKSYLLALLFK